jgi:hypothetical protein
MLSWFEGGECWMRQMLKVEENNRTHAYVPKFLLPDAFLEVSSGFGKGTIEWNSFGFSESLGTMLSAM